MSHLNKQKEDHAKMSVFSSLYKFFLQHKSYTIAGVCLLVSLILIPEVASAANLEEQLDKINTLTTSKIKTYGISAATIAGSIWSLFKGNIKMAGVIVLIGVIMAYYLNWIADGMKV